MIGFTELTDQKMVGSPLPWWQGMAYRRPELRSTVVAPIPLNWIIGKARDWWWRVIQGPICQRDERIQAVLDTQFSEINEQRWKDRFDDEDRGYTKGWQAHLEAISRNFDNLLEERNRERDER